MKHIITIFLIVFATATFTQAQGIEFFQGTWQQALDKAKEENKPVFVDAYTTWCGPCKYMASKVFTVDSVGEYFNENFINYKFDMEKGEGPSFANKYRVTAYPTLLYINAEAKVIHRVMGMRQPADLIKDAQRAKVVFDYK